MHFNALVGHLVLFQYFDLSFSTHLNTYHTVTVLDCLMLGCGHEFEAIRKWTYSEKVIYVYNTSVDSRFTTSSLIFKNYSMLINNVAIIHDGIYTCVRGHSLKVYRHYVEVQGVFDLKMDLSSGFLLFCLLLVPCLTEEHDRICKSPQFMNLGESGIIECSFEEGFYFAAWYNSRDPSEGKMILQVVDGVKDGQGYYSGLYDVCKNGSLVIDNVTLGQEHTFSVVVLHSRSGNPVLETVEVIVTVMPPTRFPIVNQCKEMNTICYRNLPSDSELTCSVQRAKPVVFLHWVDRTEGHERNVSFQTSVLEEEFLFTTLATTSLIFPYSSVLSLLTCAATAPPGLLLERKTTVLVENSNVELSNISPVVKYVQKDSQLLLSCSNMNVSLILWKKAVRKNDSFQVVAYAAHLEEDLPVFKTENYQLNKDGSLVHLDIEVHHEGLYQCVFEYDGAGGAVLYQVNVFVPALPVIHGCAKDTYCVLEAKDEGTLMCSLQGIRPKVLLELATLNEKDAPLISFTNQELVVTSTVDVYDITLKTKYQLQDSKKGRISFECRISGSDIQVLQATATFDIIFPSETVSEAPFAPISGLPLWTVAIFISTSILVISFCVFLITRGKRRSKDQEKSDEELEEVAPMVDVVATVEEVPTAKEVPHEEKKGPSAKEITLLKELKAKYQDQYDAVQPIPYIRDRLYCVDRVFVEGGFEKLISKNKMGESASWEKLDSYHRVINSASSSTRAIIEGDPGYGKSTLTLQLAYDWCNSAHGSPLASVGIFILLRLRQLGGVQSFFKAIKQFILPRDSILEETDIATVLHESKSTVIILDGYDEYPDEEANQITDIISIIRREMFQEKFVILTTRSSLLPKSYPPNTQRIRLTGFNEKARDAYIRKAVVGEDEEAAKKIKRGLDNNPVLQGLCQVPLFFVMFAHMTHESETFLKFNSVTSFFRYMISCFHNHLANKLKDPNVKHFISLKENHNALDEVAFDGLSGKKQKIVWDKSELLERLGIEFYIHYKQIGILVEEEVLDLEGTPENIQYKTEVRFYHKLFCEWYAAHYLSRKVVQSEINLNDLLEHMNPFDLQYTYRFACGLNPEAGDKIIEYLRGIKDGDKFAVLCILEQSGKIDLIKDTIRDLCSNYVIIDNTDSMLLQGSMVQLLEIGAGNQMPISFVWLKDCFQTVDLSTGKIHLKSTLSLPVLATVEELAIGEKGRHMTNNEVSDILHYALMCTHLKTVRFCQCTLPQTIQAKSLPTLKSREIQVLWITEGNDSSLNPLSGEWEEFYTEDGYKIHDGNIQARKNLMISLTKGFYKQLTTAFKPVLTDQQYVCSVDQIFVDGGIEKLTHTDDKSAGKWEEIDSYQTIFAETSFVGKRLVIHGKASCGKSTLTLKIAHDWCNNSNQSLLSTKFDIFFLIRLSKRLSRSIYTQLKHSALPKDTPFSGHDIQQVLECSSGLIVIDDVDFCTEQSDDKKYDILDIVQGVRLKHIDVIFTCTIAPKICERETIHLRLTAFDDKRRIEYIKKVFAEDKSLTEDTIAQKFHENSMIEHFCKVPFFFILFTHELHRNSKSDIFDRNIELTKFILENVYGYLIAQMDVNTIRSSSAMENPNYTFGVLAAEGLCNSSSRLEWSKDKMIKRIGKFCYDYYVQMGILVEHEVSDNFNRDANVKETSQATVGFFDSNIMYWYATNYAAYGAIEWFSEETGNVIQSSSNFNLLRHSANTTDDLAMFWTNDRESFDSGMRDIVKALCSTTLIFRLDKKRSKQHYMVRILEIASNCKISISCVSLTNCYSTVDLRGGNNLQLKSNLSIPVLTTLNKLVIDTEDEGREITSEEFTGILQYSSKCLALKELKFYYCLLPSYVQTDSVSVPRSRNVKVSWYPQGLGLLSYQLNLQSGCWEGRWSKREMTDEDYRKEVREFRQNRR